MPSETIEVSTHVANQGAPIWRRLFALVYDLFLLCAISMCYSAAALGIYLLIFGAPADQDYQPIFQGIAFQLGWFLSLVAFFYYFWITGGQTAGMRAWRIKLVSTQNKNVTPAACFKRVIVGLPSFFVFFLGYLYRFIDKNKDCLHDKLSQTRVVVTEKNK